MEEGFNYPAGTGLAANLPWAGGIGPSMGVVSGSLALANLQDAAPAGNMLQISGGTSRTVYRNFSSNAVTGGAVYCSALIRCLQLPTISQFITSLLPAGSTSRNRDTDPLALSVTSGGSGYRFSLSSAGGDSSTGGVGLTANSTHFIVLKYVFGSAGQASMYVDPAPGGVEPSSATISPEQGDPGTGAANLQVLLLQASSSTGQGIFNLDTVRIGTTWADVTPLTIAVSLAGPQNQAVCSGSPVQFNVSASGVPPFSYQWRTNGIAIGSATNNTYLLLNPNAKDAFNSYDVVVSGFSGSVTSKVASLMISYSAPSISISPSNQMIVPGVSNANFSVSALGDAPLSFQWRTNGTAIPGATNTSYTITNAGPADMANAIDVVASNPCGSITSTPPVAVYFPTLFYAATDAGAGFFSGENVIFTNASGLGFYVWSSPDPAISVTNWTLEGPMSELPLGTSGYSRYGINLNPATSPVYYIFAQTSTGPYTPTEPVVWLTTPDFASYYVTDANVAISAGGIFEFPAPPGITQQPSSQTVLAGQNANFNVTATGAGLGYQWLSNNLVIPNASAPNFSLTNVSPVNAGLYVVIVTNSLGAITSSVATLTVALPPAFNLNFVAPETIELSANAITGLTYVVQSATDLINPIWVPILTNNTGNGGIVNFQTSTAGATMQFYRLVFP